jgi:Arc/MetJ family transcription regulator
MVKQYTITIDEQLHEDAKRALGTRTMRATIEEALRRAIAQVEAENEERRDEYEGRSA